MAVTLKQIAERLNTSQATVSLVLNGKQFHRVSPQTRERIEQTAREMGYRPNRQAQILAHGKTHAVGLIVNKIGNPFFGDYVSLIEQTLADHGYHVLPMETRSIVERERSLIQLFEQQFFDAVLCLSYNDKNDSLFDASMPLVARLHDLDGKRHSTCPWPHVSVEYGPAIVDLVRHLACNRQQNVGLMLNQPEHKPESRTSEYFRKAIARQAGVNNRPEWNRPVSEHQPPQVWYEQAVSLLTEHPEIDALMVYNAASAPPIMAAAEHVGRPLGGHRRERQADGTSDSKPKSASNGQRPLAIATFDNPSYAAWMRPGLTVICEPVHLVAEALTDRLLSRLEGRPPADACVVKAELKVRGSTQLHD